jgi:hypothetical protein
MTNNPLHYTLNPAVQHQLQQSHPAPHQSIAIHPSHHTVIPQLPSSKTIVALPAQTSTYHQPQPVAVQRPIIHSLSPRHLHRANQSIVTDQQHIEQVTVSKIPNINVIPASKIKSNIVQAAPLQSSIHLGAQVLRMPDTRQSMNVQSPIHHNHFLPQQQSFQNLHNAVVTNGGVRGASPFMTV